MNVQQTNNLNGLSFGRKQDIPLVRQAAKNLRGVYHSCQEVGCFSKGVKGRILVLDRKMGLRTKEGFNQYIESLSRKQVKELLYSASIKIKNAMRSKASNIKSQDEISEHDVLIVRTIDKYLKTPLVSLPGKN